MVICSRCNGTGYFQQYTSYKASILERQFCHSGFTPELINGLRVATGDVVYRTTAVAWKRANQLDFDKTEEKLKKLYKSTPEEYKGLAQEFCDELKSNSYMNEEIEGYSKYRNDLISTKIKCTKVVFRLDEKDYDVVFVGDNNLIIYDNLPKFKELSFRFKIRYFFRRILYF